MKSNLYYQTIFENAPIGVYTVEADGTFSSWNRKMAEISGSSGDQVIGQNAFEIPTYKKWGIDKIIARIMKGKKVDIPSLHYMSYFGNKESYRHYRGAPIFSEDGKTVERALLMVEDITEQKHLEQELLKRNKELEQEKSKLSHIAENMDMGAILFDNKGRIMFINREAKNFLGVKNQEAAKVLARLLVKFPDVDMRERFKNCISGRPSKVNEAESGEKIFKILFACVRHNNHHKHRRNKDDFFGHLIYLQDITKEKILERSKSEFVSLASHQLRTPLSTINWYAEMLLSDDVGKITDGQKRYIEKVYKNSRRMAKLVQALLNVSKIELSTLAIKTKQVNLKEITESVIDELLPQIQGKKLKFERKYAKNLPIVATDSDLIRIILQNILLNAVKYNVDNGRVSIEISAQSGYQSQAGVKIPEGKEQRTVLTGDKESILFTISDTGLGIPESQQSKIFTKLFRADNAKENDTDGTGLGLYIAKEMLYKLGGKIWFKSEENKGTTFFITLPVDGGKSKDKKVS